MQQFTYSFVLDDWQIATRTVSAKSEKQARDKIRAQIKRQGKFKKATSFIRQH
jgi:type II secretory pathway component PulF